jgi:hypothetical protein
MDLDRYSSILSRDRRAAKIARREATTNIEELDLHPRLGRFLARSSMSPRRSCFDTTTTIRICLLNSAVASLGCSQDVLCE